MLKVIFSETIEVGNHKTGRYRRWEKKAELEGSAQEVSYFVNNISSRIQLPGVSARGSNDNFMISGMGKLLQLED